MMTDPTSLGAALREGFCRLGRTARLVFPLHLANLVVALFAVLPLYAALHQITAHRPAAGRLITTWDLEILAEIVTDHPSLLESLHAVFLFVPLFYLLLSQLLLAGALGALHRAGGEPGDRETRSRGRDFGRDAFTHFLPFLRLFLWSALPFALSALALGLGYFLTEKAAWPLALLALLPGLAMLASTSAALDYARAHRILGAEGSAAGLLLVGFRVVFRRPLSALGLHLGFALLGLVPLAVLVLLPDSLDAGGTWPVLLAFLLRQAILCVRLALRLASLGAHLAFLQPRPVTPRVQESIA